MTLGFLQRQSDHLQMMPGLHLPFRPSDLSFIMSYTPARALDTMSNICLVEGKLILSLILRNFVHCLFKNYVLIFVDNFYQFREVPFHPIY